MLLVSIGTSQDADVHPTVHRQSPNTKNHPAPKSVVPKLRNLLQKCYCFREKEKKKVEWGGGIKREICVGDLDLGRSSQGGSASLRR